MRLINWLILGFVVLILAATTIYSGLGTNNISVVVDTNGNSTDVNYQSILAGSLPQGMVKEIKNKAFEDVQSSNSTVTWLKQI